MKKDKVYVGIDVSKAHLDVAWGETLWRISNDAEGHRRLRERLATLNSSFEP